MLSVVNILFLWLIIYIYALGHTVFIYVLYQFFGGLHLVEFGNNNTKFNIKYFNFFSQKHYTGMTIVNISAVLTYSFCFGENFEFYVQYFCKSVKLFMIMLNNIVSGKSWNGFSTFVVRILFFLSWLIEISKSNQIDIKQRSILSQPYLIRRFLKGHWPSCCFSHLITSTINDMW